MRILHIALSCFYIDNYAYQENLLPKYHKEDGNDVFIISSLFTYDEQGKGKYLSESKTYINEYGIEVSRLDFKKNNSFCQRFRCYKNTYESIEKYAPDIIFIHGVQFTDIKYVVKYVKNHPNVKVYADNHSDFINSGANWISKNILHKIVWRNCAKKIEPYTTKFYGVLPARVDFLRDVYGLPRNKTELLVMGADDDKVSEAQTDGSRKNIRDKYGIEDSDFLILTGGKIDYNKPETLNLMQAMADMPVNVKLLIFGSVVPSLKEEFEKLLKNDNIIYIGWINSTDVYQYFAASDLVVFPGKHSVLWEQAVGMGVPCIFRKLDGFTHVDIGGNCVFTEEVTTEALKECLSSVIDDKEAYKKMLNAAREKGMKNFSYKDIARRSIM